MIGSTAKKQTNPNPMSQKEMKEELVRAFDMEPVSRPGTGFFESIMGLSDNFTLPSDPKPTYPKWGRGRPSKEKLAQRQALQDWYRRIKVNYKPRGV